MISHTEGKNMPKTELHVLLLPRSCCFVANQKLIMETVFRHFERDHFKQERVLTVSSVSCYTCWYKKINLVHASAE